MNSSGLKLGYSTALFQSWSQNVFFIAAVAILCLIIVGGAKRAVGVLYHVEIAAQGACLSYDTITQAVDRWWLMVVNWEKRNESQKICS